MRAIFRRALTGTTTTGLLLIPVFLSGQTPRARDSAGVRITENRSRSAAAITFALAPLALYDIGGLKSNPDDELDSWFLGFPTAQLSSGGSVIGDRTKLRFFDSTGKQFKIVGREGQGPQEFQQTTSICVTRGDTVLVSDNMNRRISIWDKAGTFVREFSVPRLAMPRAACFSDGTFLLQQESLVPGSGTALRLERWRTDGTMLKQLGVFGGSPPFNIYLAGTQAGVAASGMRFFVGDPRASEVKVFDADAKLTAIFRTDDPIAAVTAAEADAMQSPAGAMGSAAAGGGRDAGPPPVRPKPSHWPAYGTIRVDPSGRLWIADYRKGAKDPYVWTSFDPDGRMLGKFTMPAQTVIDDPFLLSFTRDGAVVRFRDSDGSTHLATYRFIPVVRGGIYD